MLFRTISAPLVFCLSSAMAVATGIIRFPDEGRWSVATGWTEGWSSDWHHTQPVQIERAGEWTILRGTIELPTGILKVQDAERTLPGETTLTEVHRRWEWTGQEPIDHITLSVRVCAPLNAARPFLPGISTYDNPAGQSVDASRIPVIAAASPLRRGFYEEHRFPLVFAAIEGVRNDGTLAVAALHSVPSPLRFGHRPDQWWSLGVDYADAGIELALLSGAVASNGRVAIIKGHQRKWHDYPDAWCTLPPGAIVEKTFFVESAPVATRGTGFQIPLHTALRLTPALNPDGFPAVRDVLGRKFSDTLRRWREGPGYAGIQAFPGERHWIDLGWAGQSEAFAFPLLRLGTRFGLEHLNHTVQRALDFIATSPFGPDGFAIRFDYSAGRWSERTNPLSQGQAMENLLHALRLARAEPGLDVTTWERFLRRACDVHAARILAPDWHPVSTNEGFLIAPLAHASPLLGEARYLEAARKAADHYASRHLSMDEPYWGGTLDARCEDKEGAWAAFQGFLVMHEVTHEEKYLTWATHAADVVLSYLYVWDVPLPSGRLADHAFKTRGWTAVSVQNMHLDVYGVLCAPAFWRLGELTGRDVYQRLARLMYVSCGQLLDAQGSQGEQVHQTNYAQHYDYADLAGVRGDYVETWNVYWISAHFLVAAAQFDEMGIDVLSW